MEQSFAIRFILALVAEVSMSVFAQDYSGTYLCDVSSHSETTYIQIVQDNSQVQILNRRHTEKLCNQSLGYGYNSGSD